MIKIEKQYHKIRKECKSDQEAFDILERSVYLIACFFLACEGRCSIEYSTSKYASTSSYLCGTMLSLVYRAEDGWNYRLVKKGLMSMEQFAAKQTKDFVDDKIVGKAQAAGAHFGASEGAKFGMQLGPHAAIIGGICGAVAGKYFTGKIT